MSNSNFRTTKTCRLCHSHRLVNIIAFGDIELANCYSTSPNVSEKYPLTFSRCEDCKHAQLREVVRPDVLFNNYYYKTSDSHYLRRYFHEYPSTIQIATGRTRFNKVLEIGSNCGFLLKEIRSQVEVAELVGVDPAQNITLNYDGITVYRDFFGESCSKLIEQNHGKFDVIIANHVMAHIADIEGVTKGIANCLSPDGVFVMENAYLMATLSGGHFDQIYHEHLDYHSVTPLCQFFKRYGLEVFKVSITEHQGGSIRLFVKWRDNRTLKVDDSVEQFLINEERDGLLSGRAFDNFLEMISAERLYVAELLQDAERQEQSVSCYGCPAKFALFCKYLGLSRDNVQYVVDDTPGKQGHFAPETKIPIVNREVLRSQPTDYCIVSAWNVADEIVKTNPDYSGRFVVTRRKPTSQ